MKKITTLFVALAMFGYTNDILAQNSNTVIFKPSAAIGEDALVWWTPNNCVIGAYLPLRNGPAQTQNFGDLADLMIDHWTFNGMQNNGCPEGKRKVLIRFTELANLPTNARILSATLKLFNPPQQYGGEYNSIYPGSPFNAPNTGSLARVMPGQSNNWRELSVTWDQAAVLALAPTSQWVAIPNSTRQYNETLSLNVTNIVQDIVTDLTNQVAFANNGFLLQLDDLESIYRKWYFASSDNSASQFHPELVVQYIVEGENNCDANFNVSYNTNNPSRYTFTANQNNANYEWKINGNVVSNSQSYVYSRGNNNQSEICLNVQTSNSSSETCNTCYKICSETTSITDAELDKYLAVYPNPSNDYWHIKLSNVIFKKGSYVLYNQIGQIVTQNNILENNFSIENKHLAKGVYHLNLDLDGLILQKKIVKN